MENLVTMYWKMQIYSKNWKWFFLIYDILNIHWTMWNNPNDWYIVCDGIIIRNDVKFFCCGFKGENWMAFDPLLGTVNDMNKQLSTHYLEYGRWCPSFCQVPKPLLAFFALIFQHNFFAKCKGNFHDLWSASTYYHLLICPLLASYTSQKKKIADSSRCPLLTLKEFQFNSWNLSVY